MFALLLVQLAAANPCGGADCAEIKLAALAIQKARPGTSTQGATTASHRPTSDKKMTAVYDKHAKVVDKLKYKLHGTQSSDLKSFYKNWQKNKARYQAVAAKTGIPAELIAALHWRESTANFNTYLHQGDPLGKKAVHVPRNIPLFHKWEDAAVHALTMKRSIQKKLGITANTTDMAAIATFAEYYNGLGYHNRGSSSPYVYSGTDQYKRGKYVADGRYSKTHRDNQLGVVPMIMYITQMDALGGSAATDAIAGTSQPILSQGDSGEAVTLLQQKLAEEGFYKGSVDGDFGRGTRSALRRYQRTNGLTRDGRAGPDTWKSLGVK